LHLLMLHVAMLRAAGRRVVRRRSRWIFGARQGSVRAGGGGGAEALWRWADAGDVGRVRELLVHGGDVGDVNAGYGPRSETPLAAAVSRGDVEVADMLLARAEVDPRAACEPRRSTAMHEAARFGHTVLLAKLLSAAESRGGFDVNARDAEGASLLARAAGNGRVHATKMLVEHPQVDLNAADNAGRTPLALAAEAGHVDVVNVLIDLPEVDINRPNHDGLTPEVLAERNFHGDIATILCNAGAIVGEP